jgi:DNA replication protein DnaC
MTQSSQADTARLTLALNELRLPAIKALWPQFTEQADKEGWPASRLLAALVEHELVERDRRRIARHLAQACLLPGKTLEAFDFTAVPVAVKSSRQCDHRQRQLDHKGQQYPAVWPARCGQVASCLGHRPLTCRERLSRSL